MKNKDKIMKTILTEIQRDMDDFFAEMDKAIGRKNVTVNKNLWKNKAKKLKNNA